MPAFMAYLVASVRIVYTQFPEDILPVAVYRMEAEVSSRQLFLWLFSPGLSLLGCSVRQ